MMSVRRSSILAAVVVLLGCLTVKEVSSTVVDDVLCHSWQHHTFGAGLSCCQHKTIHPGISENLDYKDWQLPPTDDHENITCSTWRAYSNLLGKSLGAGKKVCLKKFTELMTKNYPDKVKGDIKKGMEKVIKSDGKKKPWLEAEFELTDYENINRIRVTYFQIEKAACGKFSKSKTPEPEINMWGNCQDTEEMSHRDGGCCRNITLPFYDHHHQDQYHVFKPDTCNKTLGPLAKKLKISKADDIENLTSDCQFACFLVEKKHIKLDDLLAVKEATKLPVEKIVKLLAPIYLSKDTLKYMKDYVDSHLHMKHIMKQIPDTMLGSKVKAEDILGCFAYDVVSNLISNSLHEYCYPDEPHSEF